jgi:heme-degrading monooxygenase HmoA
MPIVNKANGLLAEFAIFPVEPESQANLVASALQNIESTIAHQAGFASGSVLRSRDGLRVTSYIQWSDSASYVATEPFADFAVPDVHLFEIFASVPKGSELHLTPDLDGPINFGIFKMKQPEYQPRFVKLFTYALEMVSGQAGLISTHPHRSLDGWRCINFGHWQSIEDFTAMDANRPFSTIFQEMLDLANNEYQKSLHEVVFTT